MDAGLGFRDGAVVDLDFGGFALDKDALDGFAAGGDSEALGDGARVGTVARTDDDGKIGGGVTGVGYVDGDEPVARRGGCGEDAVDGQVGQTLVGINPVGEEPGEVGVVFGVFEEFFEGGARRTSLRG